MSNKQALALIVRPRPFGVKVQWTWPAGSKEGDVMFVQALRKQGMTPASIVRYPKDRTTIGALSAGEAVQIRARPASDAGDFPDWQASDWRDAKASSDASEYVSSIIGELMESAQFSDLLTTGSPITATIGCTACDDLEQQTLRDVLADMLPRTNHGRMRDVSTEAAKAIRAAFEELRTDDAGKS